MDIQAGPPGSLVCTAQHTDGMERQLSIYQVRPNDPDARAFYLQQFHAYNELSQIGVCPGVQDPFTWSEDFLVVASSAPTGVSLGALELPINKQGVITELERAAATYRTLELIHERGIIHRSIGPEKIYLAESEGQWKANLTGFHACRISRSARASISPRLNQLDIEDDYAAPELLQAGYEYADDTADTFSTSLAFLERLTGRSAAELQPTTSPLELEPTWPVWDIIDKESVAEFFQDTLGRE